MATRNHNLIPGTLNLLILKALGAGPLHGYGITRWIQERTDDVLQVEEGALYPALHRLEAEGHLEAAWGRNDTGRKAKFYTVTPSGRALLEAEVERWRRSSRAVDIVISDPVV